MRRSSCLAVRCPVDRCSLERSACESAGPSCISIWHDSRPRRPWTSFTAGLLQRGRQCSTSRAHAPATIRISAPSHLHWFANCSHDIASFRFLSVEPLMVMTKSELIASLQHEVHILRHLAGKIDRGQLGYRPSAKQRSTLELLQYLSVMGPGLIKVAQAGKFDP